MNDWSQTVCSSKVGRALEFQGKRKRGRPKKVEVNDNSTDEDEPIDSNLVCSPSRRPKSASQAANTDRTPMIKRLRLTTQSQRN